MLAFFPISSPSSSGVCVEAMTPPPRKTLSDEEIDEVEEAISRNPCSAAIKAFEECLVETDRNFVECQPQIKAAAECARKNGPGGGAPGK